MLCLGTITGSTAATVSENPVQNLEQRRHSVRIGKQGQARTLENRQQALGCCNVAVPRIRFHSGNSVNPLHSTVPSQGTWYLNLTNNSNFLQFADNYDERIYLVLYDAIHNSVISEESYDVRRTKEFQDKFLSQSTLTEIIHKV